MGDASSHRLKQTGPDMETNSQSNHGRNRRRMRFLLLLFVAVIAITAEVFSDSRKSLINHATPTLSCFDRGIDEEGIFLWRSNKEALILDNEADKDWHTTQCNIVTGKCEPVEIINKSFGRFQMHYPFIWAVSPGGQWIVWAGGTDVRPLWSAAKLGTADRIDWPRNQDKWDNLPWPYCIWLPDSSGWAEFIENQNRTDVVIHHIAASDTVINLPIPCYVLGFTGRSRLLAADFEPPGNTQYIHIDEYDISKSPRIVRGYDIHVPANIERIDDMKLSPTGDRLLWAFTAGKSYSFPRELQGFLGDHAYQTFSLRISDLDGTKMRVIGDQSIDINNFVRNWWPNNLAWTPDGKQASFIYHSTLYTVPVR